MADVTVASFEEMEAIYDGIARRARATLGVSAFGMQVMTLPANWDGYPNHRHDASVEDAHWRVSLYGKNLGDERGVTSLIAAGASPSVNPYLAGVIAPRTIGAEATYKF